MITATSEQWRDVPEWEGFYQVSDKGRVRSLPRRVSRGDQVVNLKGRVLKQYTLDGYKSVWFKDRGTGRSVRVRVHRAVALGFELPKPDHADRVCHNDGNPANNNPSNLRWDNQSGNALDRVRHGRHQNANKSVCVRGHKLADPNLRSGSTAGRVCRACANTRSWANWRRRTRGVAVVSDDDFQAHSDSAYAKIMSGK